MILGVPIVDTAFSIVRRARRGGNVTVADKDHLHHRLMRLGHGQRRSVLILWTWTAAAVGHRALPRPTTTAGRRSYVPMAIAAAALVLYTMFGPGIAMPGAARPTLTARAVSVASRRSRTSRLDLPAPRLRF